MSKMMKPEMEVVRFGGGDVIATSGYGLTNDTVYLTTGQELNDATNGSTYTSTSYYTFKYDSSSDNGILSNSVDTSNQNYQGSYAWYNYVSNGTSGWLTNNTNWSQTDADNNVYTPNGNR